MSMPEVSSVVLAGLSGGSGKSVAAVALLAALRQDGYAVSPFKKGPDYIDAGWMARAAGRPCYNLDPFLMSPQQILATFREHLAGSDLALIEGNRGLYDGVNATGSYSTAELAILLNLPVLLVVNCAKTTRTVAALVLGCRHFDPRVRIAGVILNQIATPRHERIIRESLAQTTDLPVLGIIPRLKTDIFPMRHLGVTPHQEYAAADEAVAALAAAVEAHVDLDAACAAMRPVLPLPPQPRPVRVRADEVTIGVFRDAAFQFYYEENLEGLRAAGARLVPIDALHSETLPADLDALYIGGGFPETSAGELAANITFRASVRARIEAGLPVYAECGGLIFLGRSILLEGREFPLAGVFPVTFSLARKPQAHGYSICTVEQANSFYPVGTTIRGHEFRYSVVHDWQGDSGELVLAMERGTGFADKRDGLVHKNVLALYTHVLASATPEWASGLLAAARRHAARRQAA